MNELAEEYVKEVEGFIPDMCEGLTNDNDRRDAVQDFAGDYMFDTLLGKSIATEDDIREAAIQIAEHYFGKENSTQCSHDPITYSKHPSGDVVTKCRNCREELA